MANTSDVINHLRVLCADVVQKANSGHPGAPMGMSPMAFALFNRHLKFNPLNHAWADRDRFILSNGHACALLYTLLHLTGYPEWTLDDLKNFRQLGHKAAGHPEAEFPGIELSTGPLGQGISAAVGMAIAEAHMAATYNKPGFTVVDHFTYVFCGDGCLQEGVSSEASSLAGHLGLGKLIVLYDDNRITIDGNTDLSFTEDVAKRYESYGWHVSAVTDGDSNVDAIAAAIAAAKAVTDKPSLIKVKTTIGFGSGKQGKHEVHGNPLGAADIAALKSKWGLNPEEHFQVTDALAKSFDHRDAGKVAEDAWNAMFAEYAKAHPDLAAEFKRRMDGARPANWKKSVPDYSAPKTVATRKLGGEVLNELAKVLPELMGGSADLNPSCMTYLKASGDFLKGAYANKNLRFGVREHGMVAICSGMTAHGGFIPFASTFLNFLGYCLGSVTLAALSHYHMILVFTHDSIGLGEDGPTHQPVEKYMVARETPNLSFYRPADSNETVAAYLAAVERNTRPHVIALSRQDTPPIEGSSVEGALKGAYVVRPVDLPDAVIVSTGTEVALCVAAAAQLQNLKIQLVSMPCWELFEEQTQEYRLSVFPPGAPVLAVEAGTTNGWYKYAHAVVGMQSFGASGPYKAVYEKFGITPDNIALRCNQMVEFFKGKFVSSPVARPF
mmetsp:Transcript_32773/g.82262  ORF Transcript_32773/g.82262 Transcript_32773/m.82262 type:complete len:668 (-) Transcript_32773:98-2101(-)